MSGMCKALSSAPGAAVCPEVGLVALLFEPLSEKRAQMVSLRLRKHPRSVGVSLREAGMNVGSESSPVGS